MKKRVLSLLLVACMLLTVLPAMALPVVAEETEATGATIKFVNANVNPQVVVDEQTLSGDVMSFTIPALPDNGLGWYHMAPDGTIREASTYWGEAAADMTFYLVSSKAPFNPSTNWPVFEGNTLLGWRGGWSAGSYIADAYVPFNYIGGGILQNKGAWTYGGIYVSTQGCRMMTLAQGALALSYNAPVSGDVELDFDLLQAANVWDDGLYTDITMAIAVNGVIVWPSAAKGELVTTKSFTAAADETYPISVFKIGASGEVRSLTYYDIDQSNTKWAYFESLTGEAKANAVAGYKSWQEGDATCANTMVITDYLDDFDRLAATDKPAFSVEAGDRVDIVFGRVNSPHIIAHPVLTYTEVNSQAIKKADVMVSDSGTHLVGAGANWMKVDKEVLAEPTATNHSATANRYILTENFGDGWQFVHYNAGVVADTSFSGTYDSFCGNWIDGMCWSSGSIGRYYIKDDMSACPWTPGEYGYGFRYTVERTGTVNLSTSFYLSAAGAQNMRFSVLKNDEVVYPAEGEQDYLLKAHTNTHNDKVTNLSVTEGDQLVILFCPDEWPTFTWSTWPNGGNVSGINFHLEYTAREAKPEYCYSTTFAPLKGESVPANMAAAENGEKIYFHDGWDVVGHVADRYTAATPINTAISHEYPQFKVDDQPVEGVYREAAERFFGYQSYAESKNLLGTRTNNIDWGNGATATPLLYFHATYASGNWNSSYSVVPKQNVTAGWRYTAEYDGFVDVDITKLTTQFQNGSSVAVFVNGRMVWPYAESTTGAYYADATRWATLSTEANRTTNQASIFTQNVATVATDHAETPNGSLSGLKVAVGDEIEVLIRLAGAFWSGNSTSGANAEITVNYGAASADTQSSLPANPGIDYAGKVAPVYNNGWSFVAFPAGSITESQAITDFYLMAHSSVHPLWTAAKDGVGAWSDPNMFHIYGATGQETNWGAKGSIATGGNYVVGHRYTAPYAGYANIDITKLMFANIGSGVNNVNVPGLVSVAIFVDNQKIWPADDSWFTSDNFNSDVSAVAMAAAGDALADIYLSRGSTVDLLVRSNYDSIAGITGDRYFKTRGTMFSAAIDYTAICPIYADITPSLYLGDAFAIHATVESERNYTIKLGDETILTAPGSVTKSYTNISAKNVDQDIPYQILDGDRVLRKGIISVDALLGLYEQHEDTAVAELADATMLYGAMADAYFNSSALTKVEQSALADLAAPKEAAASITDEVEEQVTFQGATLLLNDTIDMKITFKGEVTGALKVQFAYTDGSAATTVDAVLVGDTYQAVLSVPMSAYDKTLEITVLDEEGNAISETLTYGVGVYAYRVYSNAANAENTALLNVLKAISALGEKATAYQAAQQ